MTRLGIGFAMVHASGSLQRALALGFAALLVSAPLVGASGRSCKAGCPMHARAKLGCHHAASAGAHVRDAHDCCRVGIGKAGCTCGHGEPATSLPRAVLVVVARAPAPPARVFRITGPVEHSRLVDPPESPPPIALV